MDADALVGMIFVLMIIGLVGGVIILFPITLRLGKLLERRLEAREDSQRTLRDGEPLQESIRSLQAELDRLAERQAFIETLLTSGDRPTEVPTPPQPDR